VQLSICLSLLWLSALQPVVAQKFLAQTQESQQQLEVKLIPKKKAIKAGEALVVRVEIWNVGNRPVFVEQAVYGWCTHSPLYIWLDSGPPMKPQTGEGMGCAADCVHSSKETFAQRLVDEWTALTPGNFYGRDVTMDPEQFPQLKTPGRWRLGGTYVSRGGLSSSVCFYFGPVPDYSDEIKGLPFQAWEGQVETNRTWIEVVSPPSKSKK
jgi:hypothetical protein